MLITLLGEEPENNGKAQLQSEEDITEFWREERKEKAGTPIRRRKKRAQKALDDEADQFKLQAELPKNET